MPDAVREPWLSSGALERAWGRVRENHGCAGADGVTVDRFAQQAEEVLDRLPEAVESGSYRALPLLPIEVQKRAHSSGIRTLMVPAVRDRILQTAAARHLGAAFDDEFLDCSFAYRPHRSVNSAIARIRLLHEHGYRFVATADIDSFFDRIDQALLCDRLRARIREPVLLTTVEGWVHGVVWDGHAVTPIPPGVPQGSPISPLLANLFLQDFDRTLEAAGLKTIRYADDFLILAQTRGGAEDGLELARESLTALHLTLKAAKVLIRSFDEGFRFLGALFLGEDVWIPWGRHDEHRKVFSVPRPMPARLVTAWLKPAAATSMAIALSRGRHRSRPVPEMERGEAMAFLYVTEQGAVVRKSGERLLLEREGTILLDVPHHRIEAVILLGNVQITTQAMGELLDAGIPVSLASRHGQLRGTLEPPLGKNVLLRLAQFELHRDSARSLEVARRVVHAKLENSAVVLATFGDRAASRSEASRNAVRQLDGACSRLAEATTLELVDGIEGAAARLYFTTLFKRNKSEFVWPGRVRHPATDPINALLSFGYALLGNEIAAQAEAAGLDSYVGHLHQIDYGRRSLALDLLEPFRAPVVDRLILTLLNRRQFAPMDFEKDDEGGVVLRHDPCKRFLIEYERWMLHAGGADRRGFRSIVGDIVRAYAGAVRDGGTGAWQPFLWAARGDDDGDDAAPPVSVESIETGVLESGTDAKS